MKYRQPYRVEIDRRRECSYRVPVVAIDEQPPSFKAFENCGFLASNLRSSVRSVGRIVEGIGRSSSTNVDYLRPASPAFNFVGNRVERSQGCTAFITRNSHQSGSPWP